MSGQKGKIAEFFRGGRGALLHYIRSRIVDTAARDAEDILQDVLVGYLSSDEQDGIENTVAYLYRSVCNRIVDLYRRGSRDLSLEELPDSGDIVSRDIIARLNNGVHDEMERRELGEKIFAAIDRLSPDQQAVWVATELEGHTFQELSVQWDEPIGTLLSRKSRATKSLRLMLKDEFAELNGNG